ncbi:MAG: hypothetical protein Q8P92_03660 [Candidatus Daviesbacteria bacterium]|nr:hypothetical protein [Candidatus Daviesbacteria bacterium]
MTDLQTLNPFSTKPKEVKVAPQNQIGGSFENFEIDLPNPQRVVSAGKTFLGEALSSIGDLIKDDIAGQEQEPGTMPAIGSIEFQNNVAKTPELLEKEQEAQFKRQTFAAQEKTIRDVEGFSRGKIMDELVRAEVAGMNAEERNRNLGFNLDLDERHTNTAYHIQSLRAKKKEQIEAIEIQNQQTDNAQIQTKPAMREGELLMGNENPNHFTKATG